jgi:hypothetical protein
MTESEQQHSENAGIYLPYNTISTFADDIDNIVLITSIEVFKSSNYFFSSTRCHLVKKKGGGSGEERGGKSVSKFYLQFVEKPHPVGVQFHRSPKTLRPFSLEKRKGGIVITHLIGHYHDTLKREKEGVLDHRNNIN